MWTRFSRDSTPGGARVEPDPEAMNFHEMPAAHPSAARQRVLITGATGYLGRALVPALLAHGHTVTALVRPGSEAQIVDGRVKLVTGNALESAAVARALQDCDTLVHLVGVSKPSPAKARQFREIDLASIRASVSAAAAGAVPRPHLVYLSVAHPAPVMRAYIAVRSEGERLIRAAGLDATCVRPWYVLGPGHRWPVLLLPVYALLRAIRATRASALGLGFVTLAEMTAALVQAVETRPAGVRVMDVPAIRAAAGAQAATSSASSAAPSRRTSV